MAAAWCAQVASRCSAESSGCTGGLEGPQCFARRPLVADTFSFLGQTATAGCELSKGVQRTGRGRQPLTGRGIGRVSFPSALPRILVIDDLFGRQVAGGRNEQRSNLCGQFLLRDITGDEHGKGSAQRITKPIAAAVFCRGQRPACAVPGTFVENDVDSVLDVVRSGWRTAGEANHPRWAMVLLDLCFYTGLVTAASNSRQPGMPEGRPGDDEPDKYFGLVLLEQIGRRFRDLPVVILSSKSRDEVSRRFTELGALGFLERDCDDGPELL